MLNLQFKETSIRETSTGGKAGKGRNRTASFAVTDHCYFGNRSRDGSRRPMGKYISFDKTDCFARQGALLKALQWCAEIDPTAAEVLDKSGVV